MGGELYVYKGQQLLQNGSIKLPLRYDDKQECKFWGIST